jgi:hypothetical protein
MNTDTQLRAIYVLSMKDGLSYSELSDITNWRERAGPECDTTLLTEKSREHITAIYRRHFKD